MESAQPYKNIVELFRKAAKRKMKKTVISESIEFLEKIFYIELTLLQSLEL